uniref:ZAD domain-containing protein n=1 Tax=Anopheles maculatus TaxID=74869 RepID=A0A182SKP9_9DIPT
MSRCKLGKAVSFPTPTRHEWSKTYLARPKDHLVAHPDSLLKQPFRPSYDQDGDPTMDCLLEWSYARIWKTEAQHFRFNRTLAEREKTAKKKFPSHSNRKPKTAEMPKERFTMKQFQNVSAKRDRSFAALCFNIIIIQQQPDFDYVPFFFLQVYRVCCICVTSFRMAKLRSIFKKHLIPNLERKCRLCLSDKEIVQSIFQSENSKETTDTLVEKIFECTAIMLSKDYDFPSPICEDCALKLDEFLLFRTKCLRSNEIYRFNRLHKQRLLFTRKPLLQEDGSAGDKPDTESTASTDEPDGGVCNAEEIVVPLAYPVPAVVIAEASASSSSDSRTVIETEQHATVAIEIESAMANGIEEEPKDGPPMQQQSGDETECNGNHRGSSSGIDEPDDERIPKWKAPPDPDDSESTSRLSPAPVVLLLDETDTTVSEADDGEEVILLPAELLDPCTTGEEQQYEEIEGVKFPIETIEQLEQLERLVRSCDTARERYINILRRLKTHDTSLSDTYQRLFADRLLIHYNYDGISPKYNKRPLKTLLLFTECMAVAWEDHMDIGRIREAVIEAVRKSHNRYNQYNHRKIKLIALFFLRYIESVQVTSGYS